MLFYRNQPCPASKKTQVEHLKILPQSLDQANFMEIES